VIRTVLQDCESDLVNRLTAAARMPDQKSGSGSGLFQTEPTSGALWVDAELGPLRLLLGLGGDVVETLAENRPKPSCERVSLDRREEGMAHGRVVLETLVGSAELTVGELSQLAVGDVIRLDSLPISPLALRTPSGTTVAHGHLGLKDGRKALQLSTQNRSSSNA
jgi:flagellar motor switch/type III secretory pathway protein FliN